MVRARDLRIGDIMYPVLNPESTWQVDSIDEDLVWFKPTGTNPYFTRTDDTLSECDIDAVWKDWNLCEVTRINLILEKYEDS